LTQIGRPRDGLLADLQRYIVEGIATQGLRG